MSNQKIGLKYYRKGNFYVRKLYLFVSYRVTFSAKKCERQIFILDLDKKSTKLKI
jgi:hypothetical protein